MKSVKLFQKLFGVDQVRAKGGLMFDLRSDVCNELAVAKPEIFNEYALQVSNVMMYAVGKYNKGAAFIQTASMYYAR